VTAYHTSPHTRNAAGPSSVRTPLTFSQLPHALIEDKRLRAIDVRLAGVIMRYARAKAEAWPSVRRLAEDLGVCVRSVQYALKRLAEAGWITSRPADNACGRVLVLVWREVVQAPAPAVQPYSQGLPRQSHAPEANTGKEGTRVSPPAPGRRPDKPMTPGEILAHYTETGWLDLPAGHPLRRMAEAGVERAMGGNALAESARRSRPRL
jgi:DNA-binding transcriptional MocR family regulator